MEYVKMAHLNIYLDDETANLLRQGAKKQNVSISHYINNLIQRALVLNDDSESIESLLKQPKFLTAFKKLLIFSTENLALMRYIVEQYGDDNLEKANKDMLQKAKNHSESYVAGLFEE